MDASLLLLLILLGLAFGSFIGAFTYRLPRKESIFKGRSKCPNCGKVVHWYDNIPLVSYIFLGGRCRHCKKRISPRYFLIETASALGFGGSYLAFLGCSDTLYSLIFLSPLCTWYSKLSWFLLPLILFVFLLALSIFVIDIEHQFIPDGVVFTGFTILFLAIVFSDPEGIYIRLFAAFSSAIFILLIHLITKGKGMGLGDVKFILFSGLLLGWPYTPVFLLLAFLTGATVGIILVLAGKAGLKEHIAFGPFLVFSLIATFIWGDKLLTLFL